MWSRGWKKRRALDHLDTLVFFFNFQASICDCNRVTLRHFCGHLFSGEGGVGKVGGGVSKTTLHHLDNSFKHLSIFD
jgi:hypothetical protein